MILLCTASQISLGQKPSGQSQGWRAKRMPSGQVAQPDKKLRGLPVAQHRHPIIQQSLLLSLTSIFPQPGYTGNTHALRSLKANQEQNIPMVSRLLCPGVKMQLYPKVGKKRGKIQGFDFLSTQSPKLISDIRVVGLS